MNATAKPIATGYKSGFFVMGARIDDPITPAKLKMLPDAQASYFDESSVDEQIEEESNWYQSFIDGGGDIGTGEFYLYLRATDLAPIAFMRCLPVGVSVQRFDGKPDSFRPWTCTHQLVSAN